MKHLLAGNGINIQFDNENYTTQQILLRILKNCDKPDFPTHVIVQPSYLMKNFYGLLYLEARKLIAGEYDGYTTCSAESQALQSFKKQYGPKLSALRITDIGPEDYYLIHDLACHKTKTQNPEQFHIREAMKCAYFYAIYNGGAINQLYTLYPQKFVDYLNGFNTIFTTNYDSNIDSAVTHEVFYIHGQFNKLADVYDPDSLRNQLPDAPVKKINVDPEYLYLYSNALSTYCGEYKQFQLNQYSSANAAIEKMAIAYTNNETIRKQVDAWCRDSNHLVSNMGQVIKIKVEHPEVHFSDNYHFDKFKAISGDLEILGLSPWNDFHIFESVDNAPLDSCTYYYFSCDHCEVIKNLLPTLSAADKLHFKPVKDFWRTMYEE